MKLKTLIHRKIRQAAYRLVRYSPMVEFAVQYFGRGRPITLPGDTARLALCRDDVVLDIGANIGDVTSLLALTGATVYAYEPDPNAYRVLSRRFALMPRVVCINKGVMNAESTLRLYFCKPKATDRVQASQGSSFVAEKNANTQMWVDVPCEDIANVVAAVGKDIGFLKMDIEGAEVQVINRMIDCGAIYRVKRMVVETHEEQIPSLAPEITQLRSRLAEIGYADKVRLDWT